MCAVIRATGRLRVMNTDGVETKAAWPTSQKDCATIWTVFLFSILILP